MDVAVVSLRRELLPRDHGGRGEVVCPSVVLDRLAGAECLRCPELGDVFLDLRRALGMLEADPEGVVRAYMAARPQLERHCFLAAYRIRRLLERVLWVEVAGPSGVTRKPLRLEWRDAGRLGGWYRRERFEESEDDFEAIEVRIRAAG